MVDARCSAPHATGRHSAPVPGVKAKDAIGLGDDLPTFNVVEVSTIGFADLDMLGLKFCLELADLGVGGLEIQVLTLRSGLGLLISAPATEMPRFSSPRIVWRSSLGGCGSQ